MTGRELVRSSLDNAALADAIADADDLVAAGVNSGEMIRIALALEDALGRALSDEELIAVTSIDDVHQVLTQEVTA